MEKFTLNGAWKLRPADENTWYPAAVPGSVYTDLLSAGRIEDPFWRDNEMEALALMEHDFIYTRTFAADGRLLNHDRVLLRCEGLDTLADIEINGVKAGKANNMHRTWEFDVKALLQEGDNEITVILYSPTRFIREAYEKYQCDGSEDCMRGFPNLRKAHCMFGWDWGPRLPDAGIWRDIFLVGYSEARIDSVYITQDHRDGQVSLDIRTDVESLRDFKWRVQITVTGPDGSVWKNQGDRCEITVNSPMLWWPNGFGEQPLYSVRAELFSGEKLLDAWERRIGLRTMTVSTEKDQWGEEFCHVVNGVKIFAMGADYIPEDNLFGRITKERTRALLEDAALANFNAIRVWGGGYYPDDWFYDACDELGLIVWQDFMFACAVYYLDDDFDKNIRAELADNIKRLRHHASLGLWCGNNEMEMFVKEGQWVRTDRQRADYIKMYEYIFPQILKEHDPDTFYWPASPSSGGSFDEPNDENRGDVHYWDVWHGGKPFTDYRNHYFRYTSEFGFQSFPSMKTIESFTEPEDRNVFSYIMEKHQRNKTANGKIVEYLSQTFLYPGSMDLLVYASQLMQAEAIRYGVEHWRSNRGRCMGAIIWQLNDCWPVASWSSIDYFGRWKALHYAAKRFFTPVLLSCEEEGTLSQSTNVNEEPFFMKKSAVFHVSNETAAFFSGEVHWELRNTRAEILRSGSFHAEAEALSSRVFERIDFSDGDISRNYLSYRLERDEKVISCGTVLFCAPKHFHFENPELTAKINGNAITVTAKAYARAVEIDFADADVLLEDNYFDMNAGTKTVKILRGTAGKHMILRSVYDIH